MRWTLIIHANGRAPASNDTAIIYAKPIIVLYCNTLRGESLNHVSSAETYSGSADRLSWFPCLYRKRSTHIYLFAFVFLPDQEKVSYIADVDERQIKVPDAMSL